MDVFEKFASLPQTGKRNLWRRIKADLSKYPDELQQIDAPADYDYGAKPKETWCSKSFLVEIFDVNKNWERMRVHRNAFNPTFTAYLDGISWDTVMDLKRECGRGDREAVELFPRDIHSIPFQVRHFWVRKSGSIMAEEGIGWAPDPIETNGASRFRNQNIA